MRTRILSLALTLLVIFPAFSKPLERSVINTDKVHSAILGQDVAYNVYLPKGYDESGQYPIVYLLHGLYDNYACWAGKGHMKEVVDELIESGELRPVVIITPNAGDEDVRKIQNGYFNVPDHNYEDFFFSEFVPTVEKRHHIISDKGHRAIMGLSMGGGGSVVYCQRHPEMFSSCYSMSGWLDLSDAEREHLPKEPKDKLYYTRQAVSDHSAIRFVAEADEATLGRLRTVKWFIDCGDDDFILDVSLKFYQVMRDRGVKAELRVRDGWHSWEYWHQALRLSLPFASRNFEK